jgi:S1-C subfamily serine protease
MYTIFVRQEVGYNALNEKITILQTDTYSSLSSISESIRENQQEIETLNSELGIINNEFDLLKATAGDDFSGIIEEAVESVVTIRTDVSQGSGFIVDDEGYIVTNYHVVENAQAATIITSDGESHTVSLVGSDPELDIALLKINGAYEEIRLADSNEINVGEQVVAIGNPLGLQFSVTQGIVSAVHRPGPNNIEAYVQIDAALNPGNSGGPLINKGGEVIGINNFKIGDSESLGFALESNFIKDSVNEISVEVLERQLI